jgi:hypothetical protein
MSARVNSVHADAFKFLLNSLAGTKQSTVEKIVALPQDLWMAVLLFTAYQVYQINGLGLLANYSCNSASVSSNLGEDESFTGTAVVTPIPATGRMLGAVCGWFPRDAKGNAISNPQAAVRGSLGIMDYAGDFHLIQNRVVQQPGGKVVLEVDGPPPPPSGGAGDYYEDGEDIAV